MKKLAHNLASAAKELYTIGFVKEAKNMLFTSLRLAHIEHPLHSVIEEMGFEKADDNSPVSKRLEIFIHVHPDGKTEYELVKDDDSHGFDNFEELVSHLTEEDESDCGCGCGGSGNCKTAAKKKNQGKKLNKPFRTPGGPKKFSVYVKNEKGNVVKVNFGSPDMEIKRDDPKRRKSFRARHKCDTAKDPTKPRTWSCRMWQKGKSVSDMTSRKKK